MANSISYQLTIDGRPAPSDVVGLIRQIEFEDHADLADMLRIKLAISVRQNGSGWILLDDSLFTRLAELRFSLTVGSGAAIPLIQAYVIDTDAQFSNDPNSSVLTVTAMDPTVLMHLEEKVKAWPNMSDSDAASAIFSDPAYNFTPVVDSTGLTHQDTDHTLMQRGTDIQFVKMLADRNGYECYVELNPSSGDVEGHFHAPRHTQPPQGVLTVNMGEATNVNQFRSRYDMLGATTADATTIEADSGSDQNGSANQASLTALGSTPPTAGAQPRKVLLSQLGMGQAAEVQRYAQAVVDRSAWSIVAEGELNTVAYGGVLQAKRPVMVRGAGQTLSGAYYVEKVLLTIGGDGSCTQRFTLRRNAVGLTGRERSQNAQAATAA